MVHVSWRHGSAGPIVELEDGTQLQAKVVVGADGAGSKVRAHTQVSAQQGVEGVRVA